MGEVQWIKIYIDMFDKRKIKKLRRLPAGNELLLIWIMLLATAGKCNAGGMIYITESVPFTEDDLADELDFDVNTIRLALKAFQELDMIALSNDGYISVLGWEEYQNIDKLAEIREQTRKRVAKCRENKRLKASNDECNVTVTLGNAIEEEEEKDKEKDILSIIHSICEAEKKYIDEKIDADGIDEDDIDEYRKRLKEDLKMRYMNDKLGQGYLFMSDEQFGSLCDMLSIDELHKYIGIIVECEKKGKHYKKKSHYQAILDMVAKDRKIK